MAWQCRAMRFAIPALFLLATAAPAAADDLSGLAGKYVGCAVSGNKWVPISTNLSLRDGVLAGDYVFIETPDRWIPGTLIFDSRDSDMRFTFIWSDIYGSGPTTLTFSAGGARFDGYWSGDSAERFPWNGVRQGSGLPVPDCTVPVS